MFAPSLGEVGGGDAGDVGGAAVTHGEAVQVAAVLGRQAVDEGRAPQRREARALGGGGEAVEADDDEDWAAVGVRVYVVDVDVAGGMAGHRDVNGVVAVLGRTGLEKVLKAPELVE